MSNLATVSKHRFTSTDQPSKEARSRPRGPYLTPLLKKFLEKKIAYLDPETNKKIKGKVKDAILWRLILNACQGDNEAAKEIINRIDGKLPDTHIDQSSHLYITYAYRNKPDHSALRPAERTGESA